MTDRQRLSRRRALAVSGTALAGALAGCSSGGDSDDTGSGTGDEWKQTLEPEDWEGVEEIRLEGYTNGWAGVAPDPIEGVKNPTLLLFAGDEYEITWENADGGLHNIAVRTEAGDAVRKTENMQKRGGTQTLSFEATAELHDYVCQPHSRMMRGLLRIED